AIIIVKDLQSLLLALLRLLGAVGLVEDEHVTVRGMVEAHPLHVCSRLIHPLIRELKDALLVSRLTAKNKDGRIDAPDSFHSFSLVRILPRDFDVVVLYLRPFARSVWAGIDG